MKRTMKSIVRFLALLLSLCCLLTLLPTPTLAAQGQRKLIALTLDDGPGYYTSRLLDGLKARGVRVTFFVLGQCAELYPNTLRRAFEEGHQIAQHTYNHPTLSTQSNEQISWQLETTDAILNQTLGLSRKYLLRNPYGDSSDRVMSQIGRPSIVWSVDSVDWQSLNSYSVRDTIVNQAFDGAIVLAHDIHATTIDGVLWAIDILQAQGYEFVTVSELYRRRGVTLRNGQRYYSCKPTGTDTGRAQQPGIQTEPVYGGNRVTLSTASSGATLYYSLDGTLPRTKYTGPILVPGSATLRAYAAYDINGDRSPELCTTVSGRTLKDPLLSTQGDRICIENPNPGTDVRYTTDGTVPTASSKCYTSPIPGYDGVLTYAVMGMGVGTQSRSIYVTHRGNLFRDVAPGQWYFEPVDRAVALNLFQGLGNHVFEPNGALSRAMFLTVLHRLLGSPAAQRDTRFTDVPANCWYSEAVAWGAENGIALGYGNGRFLPDQPITREEMCTMLDRVLTLLHCSEESAALSFRDADRISPWARDGVARAVGLGLIVGMDDCSFAPRSTATRAQACTLLLRLFDLLDVR